MGQLISWLTPNNKTLRIIYIVDSRDRYYPLQWPKSYSSLLLKLRTVFDYSPVNNTIVFEDGTDNHMHVFSEHSFHALVPRYKMHDGNVEVYHVGLHI
jgi:hypothetical protein